MKRIIFGQPAVILLFFIVIKTAMKCQATFCESRYDGLMKEIRDTLHHCHFISRSRSSCCDAQISSLKERKRNHKILCPQALEDCKMSEMEYEGKILDYTSQCNPCIGSSLKGIKGIPGPPGNHGGLGASGPKGQRGAKGDRGLKGASGERVLFNESAHIVGDGGTNEPVVPMETTLLRWEIKHTSGHMSYSKGFLTVGVEGYYYIYGQINTGYIIYIDETPVISTDTSYTGGVFYIRSGQRITVRAPFKPNMFYDATRAYFGAFMTHP